MYFKAVAPFTKCVKIYNPSIFRTLVLSSNQLTVSSLSQQSVHHLSYLSTLDLGHNSLAGDLTTSLVDSVCPPGVKSLDMTFNSLTGITALSFSSLNALASLNLQANKIEQIEDMAFSGNKQCQPSFLTLVH